jgi:hypothetical protein
VAARRAEPPLPDDSDPMLVDLARRLETRGLRVALGHRGKLGLVAANGGTCIVVETDSVLIGRTLRESLRLRPRCCAGSAGTTRGCTRSSCSRIRRPSPTASPASPVSPGEPSRRRSRSLPAAPPRRSRSPAEPGPGPADAADAPRPSSQARHDRRAARTDPTPSSEPPRHALDENDQRLREDKPPHY